MDSEFTKAPTSYSTRMASSKRIIFQKVRFHQRIRKRCQNGKVEGDYPIRKRYQNVQKEGGAAVATFSVIAKSKGIIFQKVSRASNASTKESKTVPKWQNRRGLSSEKRYQNVQKEGGAMKATFSIHGFRIAKPRGLSFREFSGANNTPQKNRKRCQNGKTEEDYLLRKQYQNVQKEGGVVMATFQSL